MWALFAAQYSLLGSASGSPTRGAFPPELWCIANCTCASCWIGECLLGEAILLRAGWGHNAAIAYSTFVRHVRHRKLNSLVKLEKHFSNNFEFHIILSF